MGDMTKFNSAIEYYIFNVFTYFRNIYFLLYTFKAK